MIVPSIISRNVTVIVGVQMVELDDAPPAAQDDDLELRQDAGVLGLGMRRRSMQTSQASRQRRSLNPRRLLEPRSLALLDSPSTT